MLKIFILRAAMINAVEAAVNRSDELTALLGKSK